MQVRTFLVAIERSERERWAAEFAVWLTATRGGAPEIKQLQRELRR